jgi:Flp pilus assembly protein TadG
MKKMRGVYMVEFAIVGALLLIVLFACIEFSRATYTFAALNEGTRRAARLAAVCPLNDPKIVPAVNFLGAAGFTNSNVSLSYLDQNGASLGATPTLSSVYYVRVGVTGYSMPLAIPLLSETLTSPSFTVTLPAESLGLSVSGAGTVSTAC